MKYLHLFLAIIFFLFAAVQWNDPDSLIWIVMYLVIAVIAFLAFRGKLFYRTNAFLGIILFLGLLLYIPDVISWVHDGMPNIADSMKASSPYIELVREFFGLLISLIAAVFYIIIAKKKIS